MAIQAGKGGEMQIVLKVRDDGTAVIEKFGNTAEKEGDKISTNWGKVGAAVGVAAAAAVTAAAVMVKNAIDIADATGKASDKLGLTTEAFSALAYAAQTTADITRDNFSQAMRVMVDNLSQAAQGTGLAKNAIADLGLNAAELAKMGPEKAIMAISDAMEKIPNQGDRVRIAMDVFRNSDMVNALRGGSAGLREMMEEAKRFGQVISDDAARNADAFNDNIKSLKDSATGLANALTTKLLPALVNITDAMLDTPRLDSLMKRRADLAIQYSQQMAAGLSQDSARAKWLLQQIDEVDSRIIEANKKLAAQPPPVPKDDADGGGATSRSQLAREETAKLQEELAKQLVVIHEATISEEQLLAEKYVKDFQVLEQSLALKLMSQEQYDEQRQTLADTYEQKANERHANDLIRMAENMEALTESLMTEQELLAEDYNNKQILLDDALMNKIISEEVYYQNLAKVEDQYNKKKAEAETKNLSTAAKQQADAAKQRSSIWQAAWTGDLASVGKVFGEVSNLMQSSSKKQFEVGKKAAIAQALVSTYLAVASGLATTPFFPLGIAMGAIALAVGISNVARIRSQQFSGGGAGGGSMPTFSASPNTGLPTGTPGGDVGLPSSTLPPSPLAAVSQSRTVNLYLNGTDVYSAENVRDRLVPALNDAAGDGVTVNVRSF